MENKEFGNWGEQQAAQYLVENGCRIICRNFRSYRGEIDIIAKDENDLIFCEVKTRRSVEYGMPAEAVNYYKKKHLYATAEYYLYKNRLTDITVRFDIIEVLLLHNKIRINHIKNVL